MKIQLIGVLNDVGNLPGGPGVVVDLNTVAPDTLRIHGIPPSALREVARHLYDQVVVTITIEPKVPGP